MVLTMTKRMSALVPIAFGLVAELFIPLIPVALFGLALAMLGGALLFGVIPFVSTI
jgi:hypothetical protein